MTTPAPVLRTYHPGSGYAVLGRRIAVLLPGAQRRRAAAVWECVDGGGSLEDLLDVLLADGIRALPSFALLVVDPAGGVRLLLRGAVSAVLVADDGASELTGPDDTTWAEHVLPDLRGWTLQEHGTPATGEPLQVADGLVRAASVSAGDPAPPHPERGTPGQHARDDSPAGDLLGVPGPTPEPATPEPAPGTQASPVAGPAPGPAAGTDVIAAPGGGRVVARLVLSTGEEIDVDRPVLIGRNPDPGRATEGGAARVVSVPSRRQEISATHLEVRPGEGVDLGAAVATDLASTNGTVLVQPGLPPEDLRPGVATALVPGAIIDLGDGVSVSVTTS